MTDPSSIHGGQDNAMTEIALALAMGFFSLMVLTLVSMGNGGAEGPEAAVFPSIALAKQTKSAAASAEPAEDDTFVFYWKGGFYDQEGKAIDPAAVNAPPDARVVLVVDPKSSLTVIMRARAAVAGGDVIVAEMSEAWMETMRTKGDDS